VVLTNAFGTRALTIGGAHLALRGNGTAIAAGSDRALTFGGLQNATIPPGAVLVSDPVNLSVPDSSDVAIDLFFPGDTAASPSPLTVHSGSRQTNYLSGPGKHFGAAELPGATAVPAWAFLARLEVVAPDRVGAVVALGAVAVEAVDDVRRSHAAQNGSARSCAARQARRRMVFTP